MTDSRSVRDHLSMKLEALVAFFLLAPAMAGCSGEILTTSEVPGFDSGAPLDAAGVTDATTGNAESDTGIPVPFPDGYAPPQGQLLVSAQPAGGWIHSLDVTSDDYAAYVISQASGVSVQATPIDGGATRVLGALATDGGSSSSLLALGNAVVFWTSLPAVHDQLTSGPAMVWTSAAAQGSPLGSGVLFQSGLESNNVSTAYVPQVAVSADGHILFFDDVDPARGAANLYVATTAGAGKTLLVTGVDLVRDECRPSVGWAGTYGVVAYCEPLPGGADAGVDDAGWVDGSIDRNPGNTALVATFGGSAWTRATLATGVAATFAIDSAGSTVLVGAPSGLMAYPAAGGAGVLIDSEAALSGTTGGFNPGLFAPDGHTVVYPTKARGLRRASVVPPAHPVTLAADGTFIGVSTISPDGRWVVGSSGYAAVPEPEVGPMSDLVLASLTDAGPRTTLDPVVGAFPNAATFTRDSSHVLYIPGHFGHWDQPLTSFSLAAGAVESLSFSGCDWLGATTGAEILFFCNGNGQMQPTLFLLDTASGAPPAKLVSEYGEAVLTRDRNAVVYTWFGAPSSLDGLWALPLP